MKILDLPLKKEWYDMIESGEKREEYRAITPYWQKRLSGKEYTHVRFRYGYTKRTMLFAINSVITGRGKPKWGAPISAHVFIIELGEKINQWSRIPTGYKDKKGEEIFAGDIVRCKSKLGTLDSTVDFSDSIHDFFLCGLPMSGYRKSFFSEIEIIGNINDNNNPLMATNK